MCGISEVDEHKWKHVRGQGDSGWVFVLIDLTPVVEGTGPARLLDMIAGRSKLVLKRWMAGHGPRFRDQVKVVAMDCRTRVQQDTCGHRGRAGDPLYQVRRILHTRTALLTDKQKIRLFEALTSRDEHVAVEITHQIYLQIIAAYEHPQRHEGKKLMWKALKRIQKGLPPGLEELAQLGRTLWNRRAEILAYFDVGVSNGPRRSDQRTPRTPPRGIAQAFRNLDHYILRSLLHSGQLAERINAL